MRERGSRNTQLAADIADHHALRMRRQQHAHDTQPRPGPHRSEHVGKAGDFVLCRFGGHVSIILQLSKKHRKRIEWRPVLKPNFRIGGIEFDAYLPAEATHTDRLMTRLVHRTVAFTKGMFPHRRKPDSNAGNSDARLGDLPVETVPIVTRISDSH